jgi:predicted RNA-binding protein with RPS1 domain
MSETRKKSSKTHGGSERSRWSAKVTKHSDALDLERRVFKSEDPRKIALSLKRSADHSKRRKGTPYQSAMSMLNFYINRAGKNLPQKQKRLLEQAKDELRDVFDRAQTL